jgi:eukaryotic-like serine/threonine-protein kinase
MGRKAATETDDWALLRTEPATEDHQATRSLVRDRGEEGNEIRPVAPWPAGMRLADGRLKVLRFIGEGGMGVVYEAFDAERGAHVALKTLSRLNATSIYGLKTEFRALADVVHPNLVRLHELFAEAGTWFFTMELLDGVPFDEWVRPRAGQGGESELDEARLRAALPQLLAGVGAIHAAGKLHRDLKPSNVLVTREGRVVVLDFGLVAPAERGSGGRAGVHTGISGTPAYMAPEQAAGGRVTAATDHYAIGVMLFEALTGEVPFSGTPGEMIVAKQLSDAPRASEVAAWRARPLVERAAAETLAVAAPPAVDADRVSSIRARQSGPDTSLPQDLDSLCTALLARAPSARPDEAELHRRLGFDSAAGEPLRGSRSSLLPDALPELVGREAELGELRVVYRAARSGTPTVVFVSGESGMGKSALCDAFLRELRHEGRALTLAGRCYERENVPYKGFDALIDELSRWLRVLPRDVAASVLPREVYALVRLFPVLGRVAIVAEASGKEIFDPQELRSRAMTALRDLLWAIARLGPLVLYIDDLQWLDRDTTALLGYLLAQRDALPGLLIFSHRDAGDGPETMLRKIRDTARENSALDVRELRVGPLPESAARALAERCLGAGEESESLAAGVIREAQGSPFFVGQLSRFARRSGAAPLDGISLEAALKGQVSELPEGSRALLEVLALAGQPLPTAVAVHAAGASAGHAAVDLLRAEQLVRGSTGHDSVRRIECYHDRVREGVSSTLDDRRRTELYAALARALEERDHGDPELLATCYEGAGEREHAAFAAEKSGDRAVQGLAFERAARLFQRALDLDSHGREARRALRIKHAEALVGAGRARDAAHAYREAASSAEPGPSIELKRKAAYHLMTAGYVDEGRVLLAEVLSAVALRLPASPRMGLLRAVLSRAKLSLRGLSLRTEQDLEATGQARMLEALWTVVQGSAGTDPFVMVDMHARYLALALDTGSPLHAARGLCYEAYLASFSGTRRAARADALGELAFQLAESTKEDEARGFVIGVQGCVAVNLGRFSESRRRLSQAAEILRTRCRGVAFELACIDFYDQSAAFHLGELFEIAGRATVLVEDAVRRGDLWAATILATSAAVPAWLADTPAREVRARFEDARRRHRPQSNYQWPDAHLMLAAQRLLRYEGDPGRAFGLARSEWRALERSQLLRVHVARAFFHYDRGACAIGVVQRGGSDRAEAHATARADARALLGTHLPYAAGWAALLEAGLAQADGHPDRAIKLLRSAIAILDRHRIAMYAAAARLRLGALLGGSEGKALLERGDGAMRAQGVKDVESMTELFVPGCR